MKELFDLFNVPIGDWKALFLAHRAHDQKLMKEGTWSPDDHVLAKARNLLETLSGDIGEEAMEQVHDMLWIYYHHGITWALNKEKNRGMARSFASRAIILVTPGNPNRLTHFLYLLTNDRLEDAEKYASQIPKEIICTGDMEPGPNPDWERAQEILADWKAGLI